MVVAPGLLAPNKLHLRIFLIIPPSAVTGVVGVATPTDAVLLLVLLVVLNSETEIESVGERTESVDSESGR